MGERVRFGKATGLCLLLAVLAWSGACRPLPNASHPLESIQEVQSRSVSELRQVLPVRLEGVVTFLDERQRMMVIQDGHQGIPVEIRNQIPGVSRGDRVRVQAYTSYESFYPILIKPQVTRLSSETLPVPTPVGAEDLFKGSFDYQRVEVEGDVLSSVAAGPGYFEMELRVGNRRVHASGRFITPIPIYSLPGSRVKLRGVPVSSYTPSGNLFGVSLFASEDSDIQMVRQAPGDVSAPLKSPRQAMPLLETIGAVKAMRNAEAEQGYPLRIRGVITYWDPGRDHLFVQDETGASYVRMPSQGMPSLRTGDRVEIRGHTGRGNFAPVIRPEMVQVLGPGVLPAPIQILPGSGFHGREENLWAQVEGVIQRWEVRYSGQARLLLVVGQTQFTVAFATKPTDLELESLVDRRVRVRGVYSPIFSVDQRLLGFELRTPTLAQVDLLPEPPLDSFRSPSRSIHSLLEYSPGGIPEHRVKVEGQVTQMGSEGSIFMADESGGIRVEGNFPEALKVGDGIRVLGFIRWDHAKATLQNAQVQRAITQGHLTPMPIAADAALSGVHDGRLVQMEGFLKEQSLSMGDRVFSLGAGRKSFTAILENPHAFPGLDRLRQGALVRLVGICDVSWDDSQAPPVLTEIRLRLRSPEDIQVLLDGPFWTLKRAMVLMAALLGILGTATAFLVLLQRRVKARTEQLKQQMEQRGSLEEQLRQAQKLEGVGRLAGGVAHDFNNLLTIINGYCEMLVLDLQNQPRQLECAEQIARAGERAAMLTRQLLAFSRKQILQPVVIDLNQLVSEMDKLLKRLITEDVRLSARVAAEPCLIRVDPGQIGQVIMNLAVNAKDAMPSGGELLIEVDPVTLDEDLARKRPDVTPGPYVRLTVSDTGVGMSPQTQERIFEPFFTTKEQGKGTGLGLSTVFGIVKQSGGHIWVYSEPGQGTSFKVFFPRVSGAGAVIQVSPSEVKRRGDETVMVVEDQEEVRKLVCSALHQQGYKLIAANDGEEALRLAHEHPGTIHLLISDVVMPGLSGPELAKRLQSDRPGLRVLYMSGYTEDVMVHKGLLEKSIDLIQKPFGPRELVARVVEALER